MVPGARVCGRRSAIGAPGGSSPLLTSRSIRPSSSTRPTVPSGAPATDPARTQTGALLGADQLLGSLRYFLRGEAVLLHQLLARARFGEAVAEVDEAHPARRHARHSHRDDAAQPTVSEMFFCDDDAARLARRRRDLGLVDWLCRRYVEHASADAT